MKVSELIKRLELIQDEHGDLEIYKYKGTHILEYKDKPRAVKLYYQLEEYDWFEDELVEGKVDALNVDLFELDITRPIIKGIIL